MKKTLLLALMATAASMTLAEQKTVKFDFTQPTVFGYEAPEVSAGTNVPVGDVITLDGVTVTPLTEGTTKCRFYNSNNAITFRLAKDCSIEIAAGGKTITSLSMTGANNVYESNFSSNQTNGWNETSWTGEAESITIVRTNATIQIASLEVTYETGGGSDKPVFTTESYVGITAEGLAPEFANSPEPVEGTMTVNFGTDNVDAIALSSSSPKNVVETEPGVFPGWDEWNTPEWKQKNVNMHDKKDGYVPPYLYWIEGTGNPVVETFPEAVMTDGNPTGTWRPNYTYYEADGSKGMPIQGLYYKFNVKKDGDLKIFVWSNKGGRNTFIVDESTQKAIPYEKEGYVQAVQEPIEVTLKDINGADSATATINKMRFLSNRQIDSLHFTNKNLFTADTTFVNDALTGPERVAAENVARIDTTDIKPWVIGHGNRPFYGWLTIKAEAGKTYWLFQDSSQIGFGGYDFTYEGTAAIEEISDKTVPAGNGKIYDLSGRQVKSMTSGNLYVKNGKKILVR